MSDKMIRGLMFLIAGFAPIVVYLGLGPDGTGILDAARTEQVFAYLFFSLPIAFMMTRKVESNLFLDSGLLILVASMSAGMVAGALRANFSDVADALTITAYSSTILGAAVCGIGILRTNLFPKWLSGLFTAVASLAFILMAIGEPADFGNSAFIIHCKTCFTVFMSFHLLLAVLGVFVIRIND